MTQKIYKVEGIGEVIIAKRRGNKNMRLSVTSAQKIKLSMPYYVPYTAGLTFINSKRNWIEKHSSVLPSTSFYDGQQIGKSFRLNVVKTNQDNKKRSKISGQNVIIYAPNGDLSKMSAEIEKICEKALKKDAGVLLKNRLEFLARKFGFTYKELKIKKLTSRWGSCTSDKIISLSFYLIQLPWELIDYVLLHELTHTVHLNHQKPFWDGLISVLPNARELRKKTRLYKPVIVYS